MKIKLFILSLAVLFIAAGCANVQCTDGHKDDASNTNAQEDTTASAIASLTEADFLKKISNYEANGGEWKYLGDKPAVIDFYADWCGPCRKMFPILEEVTKEFEGKIYVYKVNIDNDEALAEKFKVQTIPTFLFIPLNGEPKKIVGSMSKQDLTSTIKEMLK